MSKIYTKTGDKGETGLFGGKRVAKDNPRICAYGDVDELNAVLGLAREENDNSVICGILRRVQGELFVLGADLAMPLGNSSRSQRITVKHVSGLEKNIDEIEKKLPALKNFILPAGGDGACFLHLARTVCRRAERSVVALARKEKVNEQALIYLNRLSDLLFVIARLANKSEKIKEEIWERR